MVIIFLWIVFGLTIGWIATIVDDEPSQTSLAKNLSLGIVGSIIGGLAGHAIEESNNYATGNISTLLPIIGGVLVIVAAKGIKKHRTD